jgi:hypothetical protein
VEAPESRTAAARQAAQRREDAAADEADEEHGGGSGGGGREQPAAGAGGAGEGDSPGAGGPRVPSLFVLAAEAVQGCWRPGDLLRAGVGPQLVEHMYSVFGKVGRGLGLETPGAGGRPCFVMLRGDLHFLQSRRYRRNGQGLP